MREHADVLSIKYTFNFLYKEKNETDLLFIWF